MQMYMVYGRTEYKRSGGGGGGGCRTKAQTFSQSPHSHVPPPSSRALSLPPFFLEPLPPPQSGTSSYRRTHASITRNDSDFVKHLLPLSSAILQPPPTPFAVCRVFPPRRDMRVYARRGRYEGIKEKDDRITKARTSAPPKIKIIGQGSRILIHPSPYAPNRPLAFSCSQSAPRPRGNLTRIYTCPNTYLRAPRAFYMMNIIQGVLGMMAKKNLGDRHDYIPFV